MIEVNAGRGADPAPGAGCLLAGSVESPEITNSLALRLPAFRLGGSWEALGPPPNKVSQLPVGTTDFLFLRVERDVLINLGRAGEGCTVEIAFITAKSYCLGIMLGQGTRNKEKYLLAACCSF